MSNLSKKIITLIVILVFTTNLRSQDKDNPWVIGFGINAVDFYPTNINGMVSEAGEHTQWFDQFFNVKDHYNYITAPTILSVGRYLNESFNVELAASINKISKLGSIKFEESISYFAFDINLNYDINKVIGETSWFDPYAIIGGGLNIKESDSAPTFNSGLGAKLWFYKKVGFKIQTVYKHFFNNGSYPHFQHSASIIYKFGGSDLDNDGIYDKDDKCPENFGLAKFNGCPDTDGDGLSDWEDDCPNVFGVKSLKGCPDTDGDGVPDKNDNCPYIKGNLELDGCPDTDGDGIIDKRDACPTVKGPLSNRGCPELDTDGDGIIDKLDKCKFEVGSVKNNGCPDIKGLETQLTKLASSILFVSGSDIFYNRFSKQLDQIADLMIKHNDLKFQIQGHTDNVGSEESNQKLSLRRVNKILSYLISKGVNQFNLNVKGFGETRPIDTNNTIEGRAKNRRVEIKILN